MRIFQRRPYPDMGVDEMLTGWSSDYYKLPAGASQLQDLIEYRNMNFAVATIFKACYRLGNKPGTSELYDAEKIVWFGHRELARQKRLLSNKDPLSAGQNDDHGTID